MKSRHQRQHPLYYKWVYIRNCVNYINNRDGNLARKLQLDTEWDNFKSFAQDIEAVLGLPRSNQQLVRKDMNKGWYLNNLHYTTNLKKARLQRTCSFIRYKGKKRCAKELSELAGINYHTMLWRLARTKDIKQLMKPTGQYGKKSKK